eukprot:gb/GFBE01001993.1/.p1 GENE.gb/GFBE01001993.1/~~gb/GFBE01001993.1/.p1  ORF type:complete len:220 (+),score=51.31 gb/GFBE01001993.1/:1-660(+)
MAEAAADAAAALSKLQTALSKLAPKLAPNSAPVAFQSAGEALDRLYVDEKASSKLESLRKGPRSKAPCEQCAGSMGRDPCWSMAWEVDVAKRRMKPCSCRLVCGQCAAVTDLPGLIKRLSFGQDTVSYGSEVLRHFLAINGHDAADAHLLQDAVSVAHAMLVIHKELRLSMTRGPPLQSLLGDSSGAGKRPRTEAAAEQEDTKAPAATSAKKRKGGKKA